MTGDAFGTAAARAAVLGAWRASPARLREDANTEEDHARGYYRDRVLVELAQNASDAAVRAGVPGRLLLRLTTTGDGAVLVAANTGEPLTADGVASLSSMRASAKRDGRTVGRFGVGFAAVRAVSDEVSVLSTTGGVRFSLARTEAALAAASVDVPALADEVRRRAGSLPALRLPWPAEGAPPTGYDTAVVLVLRDELAVGEVTQMLADVDDALLLGLPGLVEVAVEDDERVRRVADVDRRWLVHTEQGELPLALLADRPVEERDARAWRVTWALPRTDVAEPGGGQSGWWQASEESLAATRWPDGTEAAGGWPHVVHAPTPTDDPLTVPALLVATLPLDPTRRHVAPGPLTDVLLDRAADAYAALAASVVADAARATGVTALVARVVADADVLRLVPIGLPAGRLDAALAERIVDRLGRTALLPAAAGGLVAAQTAVATDPSLDERAAAAFAPYVGGLVRVAGRYATQARVLGVETRPLSDVVDELPLDLAPAVYAALDTAADDPDVREALAALPVALAGGRVVRGARGTLLLDADDVGRLAPATVHALVGWGVRIIDPSAAHPVLERLGAQPATLAQVLAADPVQQAVQDQDEGDAEVTDAVLDLVGRVLEDGTAPELPWLGLVELTAADGEPAPAQGLVLPGSPAARLLDERVLAPVSVAVVDRWGEDVLRAVGVRSSLVVVRVRDVLADPQADEPWVDGWADYLEHLADTLAPGAFVGDVAAVADLDAVLDGAWPEVLRLLAGTPELRAALVEPVRDEHGRRAPSYTAWWLRTRGPVEAPFGLAGGGLLPAVPEWLAGLDDEVLRALGAVDLDDLDAAGWAVVLDALPVGRAVAPADATSVWRALAALAAVAPSARAAAGRGTSGDDADLRAAAGRRTPGDDADLRVSAGSGAPGDDADLRLSAGRGTSGDDADLRAAAGRGTSGDFAGPGVAPEHVVALVAADSAAVVRADEAAVADAPMWYQRTDVAAMVPGGSDPAGLADLLDLELASELADAVVVGSGVEQPVPDAVRAVLGEGSPRTWWEHDDLRVDGVEVEWWVDDAGVHAVTTAGLAAGLAQVCHRWTLRWALEVVLADERRGVEVQLTD